jgi:hypothetical protein
MLRTLLAFLLLLAADPLRAQELPEGQGRADYDAWLAASPGARGAVLSFESWQQAAGVANVLPTWQVVRTASMWRQCAGPPFEVPPVAQWPGMAKTLRYIRDSIRPAIGPVEAVSGYRNPALNQCAGGATNSAHRDFFALDLIPLLPIERVDLMRKLCAMHAASGAAGSAGLGFYSFLRFHIDTRSFRRWGSAGPQGDESPCAVIERGGDPLAPPIPPREGDRPQDGGEVPPVVPPIPPVAPPVVSPTPPEVSVPPTPPGIG